MASATPAARTRSEDASAEGPDPPLLAIALLSAAALGYEILLTRLFSITQWHHFAYMMISVALLGYGTAGTLVALARQALLARYALLFVSFFCTAIALCLTFTRFGE